MSNIVEDMETLDGFKFRKVDYKFKNHKERIEYFDKIYETDIDKFKRQLKEYLLESIHVWMSWSLLVKILSVAILLFAPVFTVLGLTVWSIGAVFASLDVMLVHLILKNKVYNELARYDRVKKFLGRPDFKDKLKELINKIDASTNRKE